MRSISKILFATTAAAAMYFAMPARDAHAGIPVVYQTGEDIFVAGDGSLPPPFDKEPELAGAKAGYRCDIFGLFWAYFRVANCQAVAFKGDTYFSDPALSAAVAKKHPESAMQIGVWQKNGKFVIIAAALVAIAVAALRKLRGGRAVESEA
jgi:hypothetical protein